VLRRSLKVRLFHGMCPTGGWEQIPR
jgi:hypothetical protein